MERTPSKERVIPIEVIGQVIDVSEDEIDIDNFVENMNSKINVSKPPKSDKYHGDNETSSSNRGSLIITHEDGTTEENECTVTCLGISSDSSSNQRLQIEEISQDTLKDKLAEEKLKVVIPDMSQVIILEADEVTDASFVSTPEVEEPSQATVRFEKEELWTDNSTSPDKPYSLKQKGDEDDIQNKKDGTPMHEILVEAMNPLDDDTNKNQNLTEYIKDTDNTQAQNLICKTKTIVVETLMPVEDKSSIEFLGTTDQEEKGICAIQETASEEGGQHPTQNSLNSSHEECKFLESKENESVAIADSQSDEVKDIEICELNINLGDEASSEDIKENNLLKQNSNESNSSEQIAMFIEPIKKDLNLESKSEQISADESGDQDKLPVKEVITETVRIIPITLPDGQCIERGVLSDHSLKQSDLNRNISPGFDHDVTQLTSKHMTNKARIIPIHIEPVTSRQRSEKDTTDDNWIEENEDSGNNKESSSAPLLKKPIQSIENLSGTKYTIQNNQTVEHEDISANLSNKSIFSFEKKELQDAPTTIRNQIPDEVKQEFFIKEKQKESKDDIENDSTLTHQVKDEKKIEQKQSSNNRMAELDVKTINPISVEFDILDKIKQTDGTQQGNTCSDATSRQLGKDLENKSDCSVPILIQTVSESKSENINEKNTTCHKVRNNGEETKEESERQIISSLSTKSLISKVSSEETKIDNNQIPIDKVSGESSGSNDREDVNCKKSISSEQVSDFSDTENKSVHNVTEKKSESSSKSYSQSSDAKIVENKQITNIPIKIETNSKEEIENIHQNENKDNLQQTKLEPDQCDEYAKLEENSQIREDSLLEVRFQRDKQPINNALESPTSPVVRTVPIKMIDCTSAEYEDQKRHSNGKTFPEKIQLNIPIQRNAEHEVSNSTIEDKRRKSEKETELSEKSDKTKVDTEIEAKDKTKQQDIPSNQHVVISVPIEIELPDETLKMNSEKKADTESERGEKEKICENSLDISKSITLNRKSAESEHGKDSSKNPSKFPPPQSLPTSKPPAPVRTIPILRQSLSDSGEGITIQHISARQRNKSGQSTRGDILQKVHQELEEARAKLTAQANSLSSGLENMPKTGFSKNDPRSRSVESEQRSRGARAKDGKPRSLLKRERSLQDIDKDIETIWKELQELDKPDMENNTDRRNRKSSRAQTPLSEQVLVTPSWRTPTPPLLPVQSVRTSLSNPNISNPNTKYKHSLPRTTSPHTIWDTQNTEGAMNEAPSVGQLSSSWDSKTKYYPTNSSTPFSLTQKPETKPGAISPSYISQPPKFGHPQVRNIPIEKSAGNSTKSEAKLTKGEEQQNETIKTKKIQESSRIFKSEESIKSCLKSESTNFKIQSMKNRSQSPSNVKISNRHKSAENVPKPNGRSSEPDPPFEWVDFRKADGEIVKGTILPPLHRDNDVIISREVPIINVLLDDAMKEGTAPEEKNNKNMMGKEPKIQSRDEQDNRDQKVFPTKEIFNACDAGTQTEKSEKKSGCHVM